MIKAHYEAAHG
jgi:hypothetical protein